MQSKTKIAAFWIVLFACQLPMLVQYSTRLAVDPIYRWLPAVFALAAVAIFIWRWNRSFEQPKTLLLVGCTALGLIVAIVAALFARNWLSVVAFEISAFSFLATHRDRDGRWLASISYALVPLIRLPLGINDRLTRGIADSVAQAVDNILRLAEIPHITYPSSLAVVDGRLYFEQVSYSLFNWPTFVGIAMIYTAIWRRTLVVAIFNAISATFWCYVFQSCVILAEAYFAFPSSLWLRMAIYLATGAIIFLLFISSERGIRGLLMPIQETTNDSKLINPFVLAWNWCFAVSKASSRRASEASAKQAVPRSAWNAIAIILTFTLVVECLRIPSVLTAVRSVPRLNVDVESIRTSLVSEAKVVDYRHAYRSHRVASYTDADIWTLYAPLYATEFLMTCRPQPSYNLAPILLEDGWEVVEPADRSANSAATTPLKYLSQTFRRGRQSLQVYSTWLAPAALDSELQQSSARVGYLVTSQSQFSGEPHAALKEQLAAEFVKFAGEVQKRL